jgi:hypothetical protein
VAGTSELLPAIRALTAFEPPPVLPACDLGALAPVLVAHGLAPLASYQIEHSRLALGLPEGFRETLLGHFQGTVNDNVLRMVTLRGALRQAAGVPAVLLEGAAYLDWLYPHLAWRPVSDLRLAVRGRDGAALAAALGPGLRLLRTGPEGRTAVFGDGHLELSIQEGLWAGGPEDDALFTRATPAPAFGPAVGRPAREEALLCAVGDLAQAGLWAPLIRYVDVRELLRPGLDAPYVVRRAAGCGLSRALHGAAVLTAHFFPDVAAQAAAVRPELGPLERRVLEPIIEAARDPARLRHLRGTEEAARLLLAP